MWLNIDMGINDSITKQPSPPGDDKVKTAYSSSGYEKAKDVELGVYELLLKLGARPMTKEDEESGKSFDYIAVRLTTEDEDWLEKKGDLVIRQPEYGYYFHFDLTTSRDIHVLNEKKHNGRKHGLIVSEIHRKTLEEALRGSEYHQKLIMDILREGMRGFIMERGLKKIKK